MTTRMTAGTRPFVSRSGFGMTMIGKLFDAALEWRARSRERRTLIGLGDRMLRDLGLTRADVDRQAMKPFWRA
jgi:uncharacterized protein YjiS (DUF1127 family)